MPLMIGSRRALLGAPAAFNPRALGNLAVWLDAARIAGLNDGDAVTTWLDASGNTGRDPTQATAGKKPTYKTGILNGKPVVRFDGGDCLVSPNIDLSSFSALTLYAVYSAAAGAAQMIAEFGVSVGGVNDAFALFCPATNVVEATLHGAAGTSTFDTTATISTTPKLATAVYDKTLTSGETAATVNGVAGGTQTSNANTTEAFGNRALNIGSRNNAASLALTGDIAELLLFTVAHDAATRALVNAALVKKWALS